jgi:hypothetical protein
MLEKERLEPVYNLTLAGWNLAIWLNRRLMRIAYFALLSSSKTIESETIESAR